MDPDRRKRLALAAAIMGSFVVLLDGTAVNVALPAISDDLGGGLAGQQWVSNAYLLTLGSLILVGGSLGDIFGERRIFSIGVAGFGATSALCAVAPSIEVLVAGYSALGAGMATMPTSLVMFFLSRRAGRLADRIGPRVFMGGGPLLGAVGLLLLLRLGPDPDYLADVLGPLLIFSVGLAACVAPLTATVLADADESNAGIASGVNNAIARVAGLLAVAALNRRAARRRAWR